MKAIKIILAIVLIVVVLVVGAVVALLSSAGLQTALVRRHAPEGVRIEHVHVGFRGVSIDSVHAEHEGAIISLDRVRITLPLIRTLLQRELHIEEFIIAGLTVDATHFVVNDAEDIAPAPPRQPAAAERVRDLYDEETVAELERIVEAIPFDGVFREELMWPPLRIDRLAVDAFVRLPGGSQTVTLEITGTEIGIAEESAIRLALQYDDDAEDAVLRQSTVNMESGWRLSEQGRVIGSASVIQLHAHLHHESEIMPIHVTLSLRADQRVDQEGEDYSVTLALGPDASDLPTILRLDASYDYAANALDGEWNLDFASNKLADLTEQYLQGAAVVLSSTGRFAMQPETGSATLRGQLDLDGAGLDQLLEELAVLPTVALRMKFDLAGDAHQARINELNLDLAGADQALLQVQIEQAFGIDLLTMGPVDVDPDQPLLRVRLLDLPSELVDVFVAEMDLAWTGLTGELLVTAVDDEFVVATVDPVTVRNLSVSMADEALVENITVEVPLHAVVGGEQVDLRISPLRISSGGEVGVLTLAATLTELAAEQPHFDVAVDWQIELPALLAQPAAEAFRNVQQGRLKGELKARGTAAALEGQLQSSFANLTLPDGRRVDEIAIGSDFSIQEEGLISLNVPIRMALGEQLSRLQLAIEVTLDEPLSASVRGQGDTLWVDHLLVLADAFQNPDYVAPEVPVAVEEPPVHPEDDPAAPPTADRDPSVPTAPPVPVAPWDGIRADLDLALAEVRLEGQPPIRDVVVQGRVLEQGVFLNPVRARIEDSPLSAMVELLFDPGMIEQLYQLVAEVNVSRFDVGAYLRTAQPEETPPFEALVTADVRVRAAAAELEQLAKQATGHIRVTASQAIVRAFRQGRASRAVDAAAAAGRIGGLITGREDIDVVGELARYFNEITFDELTLDAQRNPDFSIDISRLALRNAELQMIGTGVVSHVEGREFHQQPIALSFDVGVRPPLDRLFDRLRLLEEEPAADGYRRVNRPLNIEGNVGEPDPRPFWAILIDAAARRVVPDRRPSEEREEEPSREPRSPLDRLQRYL